MGHFVYLMFSLYNRKKHNFQTDETTEKGKKNLIHLNSHRYFGVYCPYLGKNKYLYTYQMRLKFLFGVILCAQPPAFMTHSQENNY